MDKWLKGDDESATYSTAYGESQPAVIQFLQVAAADQERQLAAWTAASALAHPHLIRLLDSGRCEIAGIALLYVVMERAEGNLAEVLPERPLTAVEAREMLEGATAALSYLHGNGFVHGAVNPSNIMAIGEQIKLSSDSVTRVADVETQEAKNPPAAPDMKPGIASREGDVWALGATLVEALTQRAPDPDAINRSEAPGDLPEPFLTIARHSLVQDPRARWTVAQIASRLGGVEQEAQIIAPPPDRPRARMPLYWIGGGVAAMIAIILLLGRHRDQPPASVEAPAIVNPSTTVPPPPVVVPTPQEPSQPRVETKAINPSQPTRGRATNASGTWFVVVATYAQKPDAEKRASSMTRRWPEFKAEVYAPKLESQKPYYLVVLGANLTEQAATALRDRARASGLAHDAYMTRFTP